MQTPEGGVATGITLPSLRAKSMTFRRSRRPSTPFSRPLFLEPLETRLLLSFSDPRFFNAVDGDRSEIAVDVNGDGVLDLVTANYTVSGSVSVLFGLANGRFKPPVNYAAGNKTWDVVSGDLNG